MHTFQKGLINKELVHTKQQYHELQQPLNVKRTALKTYIWGQNIQKLLTSILFFTRMDIKRVRRETTDKHNNKLLVLSEEQERPLFNVKNTIIMFDLENTPPKYVLETLSLGPKNAVLNKFEPNDVLTQLDLFINHCDKRTK